MDRCGQHGLLRQGFGALIVVALLGASACEGDPKDPATWIKKLDTAQRGPAVAALMKLYEGAADPAAAGKKADKPVDLAVFREAAVPALIKAYDKDEKRLEILQALALFKDKRAVPVYLQGLDFVQGVSDQNARVAAEALGELGEKSASQPILKALAKVGGSGPEPTVTRRAFIEALGKIGDPSAVDPLAELALQKLTRDNVKVIASAANALGELRQPKGVEPLIRLLFAAPPIDSIARVALAKIGPAAVEALSTVYKGEDKKLIEWASSFSIPEGNIPMAAAVPLGHIGDKSAVPVLLSRIEEKGDTGNRIRFNASTSLGILGDPAAVDQLVKVMQLSGYPDDQVNIADALNMIGDKRAVPALLKGAQSGLLKEHASGNYVNFFRWRAGLALSRLVDDEDAPQYQALIDGEKDDETKKNFQQYAPRVTAAGECKKDVACWVKKLGDSNWVVQEKAAYMLSRLAPKGDAKVLAALLDQVGHRQEDARRAVLLALDRIADKSCTACIPKLTAQIKADRTDQKFKDAVVYDEATLVERIRRR